MEELGAGTTAALAGLVGGIALGFCARWGRFCTLNAIENAVLGGDDSGLRSWGMAIATGIIGAFALDQAGLIDISTTTDHPIVILDDDNKDVGVVNKTTLLKGIKGGDA